MRQRRSIGILAIVLLALVGLSTPVAASTYNWRQANFWALSHAQDQQPSFNGCAWFVSQALWAGGMTKSKAWTNAGVRPGKIWLPGTKAATVAEELYNHLKKQSGVKVLQITDRYNPRKTSVPEARPSDVIAYDWDGNGHVDHVSLVVNMAPNNYPVVSEWGSAPDGKISPYQYRGWSWSENHGKWQKQVYPAVRAYLVMIRQ